ncbi:DNA-binding transcriptional LysR family regulator [Paucibacter oligotrophus]|uniref:DNA-binding transcriptional LysR family regulator n=1 Tax=Roseateles oligotrophus TaxID=1769250 RepID=A0A840L570_9BURK|nr:LysR family transcriptional regulator [Roseateles oligotrophus]MBB4843156.1 DNA-binding transcriptional LysR family regulator [Roseateles oligotrophus]
MSSSPTADPQLAEAFVARRLSLRHLRLVLALYEGKSISAAAELLHVTQPAVSKSLAELEQGLGQTLFARRGRGFHATALGERLLALARKLESDLRRGSEDVASIVRGTHGELQIGATNAALPQLLPDAMALLKQERPLVTISVRTHALSDLINELRQGRRDLVLARVPPIEMPPDIEGQVLLKQREVVVISCIHPLAKQRQLAWAQLHEQAWVGHLPGTRMRELMDRMWQELELAPPCNLIETGDIMLALSMMKRLPLLAMMPQHVARLAAQQGVVKILPLEARVGLADLALWHLREPQSELVERFKQLLHQVAADYVRRESAQA